jgi:hypothetical protein
MAKQFTTLVKMGDMKAAASAIGGMMKDSLEEKAKMALLTKLVPGFAQAYTAFETSYSTTETLMSVKIPGVGKTGYELSYGVIGKPMESVFDYFNGTANQERKNIYASLVLDLVKSGQNLPSGQTFATVMSKINQNIDLNKDPLKGLDWVQDDTEQKLPSDELVKQSAAKLFEGENNSTLMAKSKEVFAKDDNKTVVLSSKQLQFSIVNSSSKNIFQRGDVLLLKASVPSFQDNTSGTLSWKINGLNINQTNYVVQGNSNHNALFNFVLPSLKNGLYTVTLTHSSSNGRTIVASHNFEYKQNPINLKKAWVTSSQSSLNHSYSIPRGRSIYFYANLSVNSKEDIPATFEIVDNKTGKIVLSKDRTYKETKSGNSFLVVKPSHFVAGNSYTFNIKVKPQSFPMQQKSASFQVSQNYAIAVNAPSNIESGKAGTFSIQVPNDFKKPLKVDIDVLYGDIAISQKTNLSGSIQTIKSKDIKHAKFKVSVSSSNGLNASQAVSLSIDANKQLLALDSENANDKLDALSDDTVGSYYVDNSTAKNLAQASFDQTLNVLDQKYKNQTAKNISSLTNQANSSLKQFDQLMNQIDFKPKSNTKTTQNQKRPGGLSDVTVSVTPTTLYIWDFSEEDGDRVDIYLNGNLVVSNYTLKNAKKTFTLRLKMGQNILAFKALNVGTAPAGNSAAIEIDDVKVGHHHQEYSLQTNEVAKMIVNYIP